MHNQLIDLPGLLQADRSAVADAFVEYMSMLNLNVRADHRKVWKFMAAQLTYNSCVGDWASGDKVVLHALFHRLVKFCKAKATKLHIIGLTIILEESVKSGGHVHAHVYIHMNKAYRRCGVPIEFMFEGIKPHIEVNTASGGAFSGAVNHGHFYVFVDKKGSLFSWSNFEPFKDYSVEAWWLDNLLKHEKIDQDVYLT